MEAHGKRYQLKVTCQLVMFELQNSKGETVHRGVATTADGALEREVRRLLHE